MSIDKFTSMCIRTAKANISYKINGLYALNY